MLFSFLSFQNNHFFNHVFKNTCKKLKLNDNENV